MKAILISIRPRWVAEILNGKKTIEVRKSAPKCELPIEVYIYCTKGVGLQKFGNKYFTQEGQYPVRNGKVVAKFTLNKIENFINGMNELEREWDGKPDAEYDYFAYEKALEKACLTYDEADEYCPDQSFYAWHISNLQIFDEPKEISEFKYEKKKVRLTGKYHWKTERLGLVPVKKAPQSWQYVEEKE